MKIKNLISNLQKLDPEAEIYYLAENEDGEEYHYQLSILENQERYSNNKIEKYYTIEKHD